MRPSRSPTARSFEFHRVRGQSKSNCSPHYRWSDSSTRKGRPGWITSLSRLGIDRADSGFGREVRSALAHRRAWLVDRGFASLEGAEGDLPAGHG